MGFDQLDSWYQGNLVMLFVFLSAYRGEGRVVDGRNSDAKI